MAIMILRVLFSSCSSHYQQSHQRKVVTVQTQINEASLKLKFDLEEAINNLYHLSHSTLNVQFHLMHEAVRGKYSECPYTFNCNDITLSPDKDFIKYEVLCY
ncbi:hypothetical protein K501DRAFT_277360 [Backusella circina FSU 941]|nr:hypothetical protein K501DRAFT_277360 [Backusella circina FSU 941]